jgi:hypothetical protein
LNIITSIFGLELSQAIANSPEYQDDAKQWRGYTDCVSMVISHEARDGAVIYVQELRSLLRRKQRIKFGLSKSDDDLLF